MTIPGGFGAKVVEPLVVEAAAYVLNYVGFREYLPFLDDVAHAHGASARGSLLDVILGYSIGCLKGRLGDHPLFRSFGITLPPWLRDLTVSAEGKVRNNSDTEAKNDQFAPFLQEGATAFSEGRQFCDVLLPTTQAGPDVVRPLGPDVLLIAASAVYADDVDIKKHTKNLKTVDPDKFYTDAEGNLRRAKKKTGVTKAERHDKVKKLVEENFPHTVRLLFEFPRPKTDSTSRIDGDHVTLVVTEANAHLLLPPEVVDLLTYLTKAKVRRRLCALYLL